MREARVDADLLERKMRIWRAGLDTVIANITALLTPRRGLRTCHSHDWLMIFMQLSLIHVAKRTYFPFDRQVHNWQNLASAYILYVRNTAAEKHHRDI